MADWALAGVRSAVEELLGDPDVDIVLTYGPVSSSHAINRGGLPKPVVAAFVLDPEAQGFPLETTAAGERVSGVPNLAYITFTGDRADEIRRLQEVVPFRRLTYLANEALLAAVPVLETNLRRRAQQVGAEAMIVRVGTSVDAALAALPPATEAVYVTPYRAYRLLLLTCLRRPALTLAGVVAVFLLAMQGFRIIPNIFFPPSDKAIFTAEYELPAGTSIERTLEVVETVGRFIGSELRAGAGDASEGITNWATFVGNGGPRYYLGHNPQPPNPQYAFSLLNATSRGAITGSRPARSGRAFALQRHQAHRVTF